MKNDKDLKFQIGSDWFRLTLQISDWSFRFQIGFRLDLDSYQTIVWKNLKTSDFRLV